MKPAWMEGLTCRLSAKSEYGRTGKRWSVFLLPQDIEAAVRRLDDHGFFLEDIAGMDSSDGLVVIYHFDHFTDPGRVVLHVTVPHHKPEIPSISAFFGGARWHEREAADFFGFVFIGHPDPTPLLLPHDMDSHPLLKNEKDPRPLGDLLQPGTIIEKDPDFSLFDESAPSDQQTGDH